MQSAIFNIQSESEFTSSAMSVFVHQFKNNKVYRSFCDLLCIHWSDVKKIEEIPFLPIELFKLRKVVSSYNDVEQVFTSSGTTGSKSKHFITDISWYKKSYQKGFNYFYGDIKDFVVLALLPNYLEQTDSSLIYMVNDLINQSENDESGFFLNDYDKLINKLTKLDKRGQKTLLIGVSFALLNLVEKHQFNLKNTIVMETGGMKGKRREMVREELHNVLTKGFGVSKIHSEYGMTELLSQAYSKEKGVFNCPPWMKILIRDTEDPLSILQTHRTGGLNVIDLANYNSCSFIATQDLGKALSSDEIEVLGRFDKSDVRGCNLMVI